MVFIEYATGDRNVLHIGSDEMTKVALAGLTNDSSTVLRSGKLRWILRERSSILELRR
jgi:hypothetical protein